MTEACDTFSVRDSRVFTESSSVVNEGISGCSVGCDEVVGGVDKISGLINFPRRVLGGGGFDFFSPGGGLG